MTRPAFKIRRAVSSDAKALAALGPATFIEAFGDEFPADAIQARMAAVYSRPRLQRDLTDPAYAWFMALEQENALGFLVLHWAPVPDCVAGPRPLELARVYVRKAWPGRGPAFALMEAGLNAARNMGAETLWLQAWEHNPRALAFYQAHGFRRAGAIEVSLGGKTIAHLILVRPMVP
jgi:ribosomal protein S18 acetylase RimI-like enzyme